MLRQGAALRLSLRTGQRGRERLCSPRDLSVLQSELELVQGLRGGAEALPAQTSKLVLDYNTPRCAGLRYRRPPRVGLGCSEPWIKIPNLGSHILALIRQRLPDDWTERYNITPVLIETLVETPRYTGAVYKASGWIHVGATQGRGRDDRDRQYDNPKKDVWLRPLRRDWKRTLNR